MNEIIREIKYKGELNLTGNEMDCYVAEDGERFLSSGGIQIALKVVEKESQKKKRPTNEVFFGSKIT